MDTLRSYTHDAKTGRLLDVPDATGISALNETLGKEGKEVVAIKLPVLKKKWARDLPERTVYIIVGKGVSPTAAEVRAELISAYDYSPEDADAVIMLKRGK